MHKIVEFRVVERMVRFQRGPFWSAETRGRFQSAGHVSTLQNAASSWRQLPRGLMCFAFVICVEAGYLLDKFSS